MIDDYYPELVQHLLQPGQDDGPFILLVDKEKYEPRADEDPNDCPPHVSVMFPGNSRFHDLETLEWAALCHSSSSEFSPNAEQKMFASLFENEKAICLVLPILDTICALSDSITKDLQDSLLWKPITLLLSSMDDDAKLLIPVPIRFLQMPGLAAKRLMLLSNHEALIIEHRHPYSGVRFRMSAVHNGHSMATIVLSKHSGKTIFFKIQESDIDMLKTQLPLLQSGKTSVTSCGFVCKEELRLGTPALYDSYIPTRKTKPAEGRSLEEMAGIERGPKIPRNENGTRKCFHSKCISNELTPDFGKLEPANSQKVEATLQSGDLVLDAQTDSNGGLRVSFLEFSQPDILFDESVIRIRFKNGVSPDARDLVKTILTSPAAAKLLFPLGLEPLHDLDPEWLQSLRLPIDENLIREYLKLHKMRDEFAQLTERTDQLIQGLLWEESADGIRHRIQAEDNELRLIYDSASSVRNLDHRIARYYPRPLSFVWAEYRKSTTAHDDARYERMAKARKAGETLVAFLALLAASYAHVNGDNVMAGWRLKRNKGNDKGKKGFEYGMWASALDAACNKIKKQVAADQSIPDLVSLVQDPGWKQAMTGLINIRNADSHLRVSEPELAKQVNNADVFLATLFDKASLLNNWSLRIVDVVKYDPHKNMSILWFREVHGSSLHMETRKCTVSENSDHRIGSGLLYFVNKIGEQKWHLLDPFVKLLECPDHCFESVFHLDSLPNKPRRPDDVVLRSFEFNSTIESNEFNQTFSTCRMLGAES